MTKKFKPLHATILENLFVIILMVASLPEVLEQRIL